MRSLLRGWVPSMFHRRLLLLACFAAAVAAVLIGQSARLALGSSHDELLAEAEAAMVRETLIPTVRGRILDRHGRVLARDLPGWSVKLPYRLFTGGWASDAARAAASAEAGRAWRSMTAEAREAAAATKLEGFQRQQEMFWETLPDVIGVDPADLRSRQASAVRRVGVIKAQYIARRLAERWLETRSEEAGWDDIDDDTVAEELAAHVIASDVGDDAAGRLQVFAADAGAKAAAAALPGATDADREAAAAVAVWASVEVDRTRDRVYPRAVARVSVDRRNLPGPLAREEPATVDLPGVATHVLGQLKPLYHGEDRLAARPLVTRTEAGRDADLGGYLARDPAGQFGVERVLESTLRGARGKQVQRLEADADGVRRVTRTEPKPGGDVTLTIDADLQAYLEALLAPDPEIGLMTVQPWHKSMAPPGSALHGSLVVLEIATGDLLAAATAPGLSRRQLEEDPDAIYSDFTLEPWTFRPTAYARAPGSTIKPLVLAAAISDGALGVDERVDVSLGYLYPNQPRYFRDWWVKLDGEVETLDGPTALKISGNTFFGKMAQRLGPQRMAERWHAVGFDRKADLPVREAAGSLWDPAMADAGPEANLTAIGQGQLTVTPVQLAAALATLARGGRHLPPRLVADARPEAGARSGPSDGIPYSTEAVTAALLGMWKSGNEGKGADLTYGTTYQFSMGQDDAGRTVYHRNFSVTGVDVYAKSGTAQGGATVEKFDTDDDGVADTTGDLVNDDNHAWAVTLVGPSNQPPLYAVVGMVEHGVSGGTAAGPLCNEAIVALQKFGYLPPGEAGSGSVADGPERVVFPEAGDVPAADAGPAVALGTGF